MSFSKPAGWDTIYFDWDHAKVTAFFNAETEPRIYHTLRDLVLSLERPTLIIGEGTPLSYDLIERKSVFDLAMAAGHWWYSSPNNLTYRWRSRFGWPKDDVVDARTIRIIAEYPGNLNSIRAFQTEGYKEDGAGWVYDELPYDYFDAMLQESLGKGSYSRLREFVVKDPEVEALEEIARREVFKDKQAEAMNFRRQTDKDKKPRILAFKRAVLNSQGISTGKTMSADNKNFSDMFPLLNDSITWTVSFAAAAADSRDQFEALLGLHAHGAKSMMRSQAYHWGWKGNGHGPMYKGAVLSDYRRQVRQLGSLVAKHSIAI